MIPQRVAHSSYLPVQPEYDRLYDELKGLEEDLGIVLSDSPTVNVGYEVLSELPKETALDRLPSRYVSTIVSPSSFHDNTAF